MHRPRADTGANPTSIYWVSSCLMLQVRESSWQSRLELRTLIQKRVSSLAYRAAHALITSNPSHVASPCTAAMTEMDIAAIVFGIRRYGHGRGRPVEQHRRLCRKSLAPREIESYASDLCDLNPKVTARLLPGLNPDYAPSFTCI